MKYIVMALFGLRKLKEEAQRHLTSALEDRKLKDISQRTHIPLNSVRLYRTVTGWGARANPQDTQVFDVPTDLDGEDAAFMVAAGLYRGFKVVYVAHSRKIHVTKDPSAFTVTPVVVGKTREIVDS